MTVTTFKLPDSLPYPITLTKTVATPGATLSRGTPLLHYKFEFHPKVDLTTPKPIKKPSKDDEEEKQNEIFGTWESPVDGVFHGWEPWVQNVITGAQPLALSAATSRPAASIVEECAHPMQIGGLCALCGKDTTVNDYMGTADEIRAQVQMGYDAAGPTVSRDEARRLEEETAERLLADRKLILIVDLDQTIVHATVDPTVGEWIAQGEAYEQKKPASTTNGRTPKTPKRDDDGSSSSGTDQDEERTAVAEPNPNWAMLKDVARFKLGPEVPAGGHRPGKQDTHDEGCDYYIKPRPGLNTFLSNLKDKYEMHVYTMGTRAYALKVCNAIDPTGTLFNERILTRDESGSMTQKSIERLFPYNSRMVVIIDDRADVWQYSPNLVKVIPYDFFVGIGDINATFLPKSPDPLGASPSRTTASDSATPTLTSPNSSTPVSTEAEVSTAERDSALVAEAQSKAVVAQLEERPLAKMQQALDKEAAASNEESARETPSKANGTPNGKATSHHRSKALLKDDDWELERVWTVLDEVHRRFFDALDKETQGGVINGKGEQSGSLDPSVVGPDVSLIIPRMKSEVLAGVHILFTSVIPMGMPPQKSEPWRYATQFGAKCSENLTSKVTHVVSGQEGTHKTLLAFKKGGIKVVWTKWFQDCIALWKRLDETGDYLLRKPSQRVLDSIELPADAPKADAPVDVDSPMPGPVGDGTSTPQETDTPGEAVVVQVDWLQMHDEIDAFLDEDDDEEGDGGTNDERPDAEAADDEVASQPGGAADPRDYYGDPDVEFDQEMADMFAEAEAEERAAYAGGSKEGGLKRRRSGSPNSAGSDSDGDTSDAGVPAKRTKLNGTHTPLGTAQSGPDEEDDDDEVMGSKQPSVASSPPPGGGQEGDDDDDDDDDSDESGEQSEDDEFLSGLTNEEGWG